ncbi:4-(cytidine 5'-diphospho)-2-C-methyl-D-erythritol kinase [Desulfovibrio sp.]|uniref:4-(cytidine 5'-diphospho)-2-C-methyl-D-erythritol kinase n=1 Tax=Desulfovibrio sp. TaxID=885 RepID=UPI0025C5787D|nr:4-(cytidine 5'-diphospho)-2-C-methyl-D-erythritol kinase [Desulfovibrio sp.]
MSILTAGCKVNLGLRITGVRPDGYHEIDSLFYPLPRPCDQIKLRVTDGSGISVLCAGPGAGLLDTKNNTLTKAYTAFAQAVDCPVPGLEVRLRKGIPSGAGLGGGSSDAAALLHWLNGHAATPLSSQGLADVALGVGADVPFFLHNRPCRVRGIGEIIEFVDLDVSGMRLVLVCPEIHVSTPQTFADYDAFAAASHAGEKQNSLTREQSRANGTFLSQGRFDTDLVNDLENVVFKRHPELADIKATLLRYGATAACMSGSGSSILGLFKREALVEAQAAVAMLQGENRRVYAHVL